jgi:hypothetical protein
MFTLRHRALRPLRAACAAIALFGLTAFGDAEKDARPNPETLAIAALQSALSGETEFIYTGTVRAVLEVCDEFDRGKDSQRRGAEATAAPVALELPTP